MIGSKDVSNEAYTDFSHFETLRKDARENNPQAIQAVAKKLEGVFLNMMLGSMREANQLFSQDSLFSSKDVQFYQQMLDQQLSSTLSQGKGIGLADAIVRQLESIQGRPYQPEVNSENDAVDLQKISPDLARYRVMALPAVERSEIVKLPEVNAVEPSVSKMEKTQQDIGSAIASVNTATLIDKELPQMKVKETSDRVNEKVVDSIQTKKDFSPISPEDFVNRIAPYARRSAATLNVPVEGIIAQAALETGWGRYTMKHADGSNALNFFGIKANKSWQGERVNVTTLEYRNGVAAKEPASFRSYANLDEAFQDYSNFLLQNPRYHQALQTIRSNSDAKQWGYQLQQAGYATDPNYGKKIASIVSRLQKDDALNITRK